MAMIRCPICGEKYSDTYRDCPFCEEEEALRQGEQIRRVSPRRGGKRAAQQPSLLSPVLLAIVLILAALLVYLLFGDQIAERMGIGGTATPPVEDVTPPDSGDDAPEVTDPADDGGVTMPSEDLPGLEDGGAQTPAVDPSTLPNTLTVAYMGSRRTEFTMAIGDAPIPLTASGGSGTYTWSCSDDGIASVDGEGRVTAISIGRATLTVHDGSGKGTCVVIVKAGATGQTGTTPAPQTTASSGTARLNNTDFTRSVSEGPYQLTVSGVTAAITWTTSNAAVATVSANGLVTPVASGTATVTASWDGQSRECIVRVTG